PPLALSPLSLHDALPILAPDVCVEHRFEQFLLTAQQQLAFTGAPRSASIEAGVEVQPEPMTHRQDVANQLRRRFAERAVELAVEDRKSTRLNSSHVSISY